jgi:hypothetical protein
MWEIGIMRGVKGEVECMKRCTERSRSVGSGALSEAEVYEV